MKSKEFLQQLVNIRRAIHRYPELGDQEFKTTAFVEKELKKLKIETHRITPTGIVGILKGGVKGKKTIALRADIDALPIQEQTNVDYASMRPGIMHACGHDANTTMALGAAMLLAERRTEIQGTIKFIFQPNEESSGGAKSMLDAGVLSSPTVDAIVGMHISPWLPCGVLGLKPREMMAAVDRFTIEIIGEGGHGAYPHLSTDAIVVAAQVVNALQAIVSREIDPAEPVVVTIGAIHGGERYNIICDKVIMVGTVRTITRATHTRIKRLIENKVRHITASCGARYTFAFEELGNVLINNDRILDTCKSSGEKVLGTKHVAFLRNPSMGGEDFAEYLQKIPGCFVYMGAASGKKVYPWHHEKFNIDERALPLGAHFLADVAQRYLNSNSYK